MTNSHKSGNLTGDTRRHDLDWLRVLAFSLLILYHVGMLYVARWGYHYKSAYTSTALENLMLLVNPWRMPLLWLISGIASAYLLRKLPWWRFFTARGRRLLLPLAFGVWFIVPPQLFVEMSSQGAYDGDYLTFYRLFLAPDETIFSNYSSGIWPHVDVNHLWFLRELWLFTLLLILLLPLLRWLGDRGLWTLLVRPLGAASLLWSVPLLVFILDLLVIPGFAEEGRRIGLGLVYFLLGFGIAMNAAIWSAIARHWRLALALGLLTYGGFLAAYHGVWLNPERREAGFLELPILLLDHLNRWFWLCAVLGLASHYLNRPGPVLRYLSGGVYTFYLVHQTLILLAAYSLADFALGPILEPLLVIAATVGGCWLSYELARRVRLLRPFLGLRWESATGGPTDARWAHWLRVVIALLISVPLGLEILL